MKSDEGQEESCPPAGIIPIEGAMETDSDQEDFRIIDRFEGQVDPETARNEMEEIAEAIERQGD